MSQTEHPRRILRSLGALFAGFVVVVTALPCAWAGGRLYVR